MKKYFTTYEKLDPIYEQESIDVPEFKLPTLEISSSTPEEKKSGWFLSSVYKNPVSSNSTPSTRSVANLSFMEMVNKYGDGVIKVTNTHLRDLDANYGVKNSKHKQAHATWKNEDGTPMPMAFDLTPTSGHTFLDLFRVLGKPEWQEWLANLDRGDGTKGWGIIDESTEEIRRKNNWKSSGNHVHLGADSAGWNHYVAAMKKYNNLDVLKALEGSKIQEKGGTMEVIIEKKEENPLGCLLCQIMNALGLRHHALSETKTDKLSDILGGNALIIIEIAGPDKVEDSFEDLIKDILPMISLDKKYSKEDIAELRKDKAKHGASMKKLLSLMSDGNILKAFNGMLLYKQGGELYAEGGQVKEVSTVKAKIGGKEFKLFEAKTDEEKEKGLMNVSDLKDDEGMIFYYDEPQEVSFWMKDTNVPLDICFFNEDEECISVKQGHPLSEEDITEKDVMFVVEVHAGSDIKPGDTLDLPGDDDEYVMHVLGPKGEIQMSLYGGERIFSRKNSTILIKKAKRAYNAKDDYSYDAKCRSLGKYVFKVLDQQDNRDPEYVQLDSKNAD